MKFSIIFILFALISINLVSSEFGFDDSGLPKVTRDPPAVITFDNDTGAVNSSDFWDGLDTINTTQMENNGAVLNILVSWLTGFLLETSDEPNLNVNRSDWWDNLNTPSDINAADITDDGTYLLATGDTATGNYTFDSTTFFIDSTNNRVGIGTASPVFPLDVVGNVRFTGTMHAANSRVASVDDSASTANAGINFGGASKFINFETDATERMRIISDGSVGIGTAIPLAKLEVNTGTSDIYIGQEVCTGLFTGIQIGNIPSSTCKNYTLLGDSINVFLNAPLGGTIFFRKNNVNHMILDADGNLSVDTNVLFVDAVSNRVGIGLSSPLSIFEIKDTSNVVQLLHTSSDSIGSEAILSFGISTSTTLSDLSQGIRSGDIVVTRQTGNRFDMDFFLADGTSNHIMRLSGDGKVGIGTVNPLDILHIKGGDGIRFTRSANENQRIEFYQDAINNRIISLGNKSFVIANTNIGHDLRFQTEATDKMTIDSSGKVGIGTIAPASPLEVQMSSSSTTAMLFASSIFIDNSDSTDNNHAELLFGEGGSRTAGISATFVNHATGETGLDFFTTESASLTSKLAISAVGNFDFKAGNLLTTGTGSFGAGNFTSNLIIGTSAFPQNLTMFSPDGTSWSCGVLNSGAWACS